MHTHTRMHRQAHGNIRTYLHACDVPHSLPALGLETAGTLRGSEEARSMHLVVWIFRGSEEARSMHL